MMFEKKKRNGEYWLTAQEFAELKRDNKLEDGAVYNIVSQIETPEGVITRLLLQTIQTVVIRPIDWQSIDNKWKATLNTSMLLNDDNHITVAPFDNENQTVWSELELECDSVLDNGLIPIYSIAATSKRIVLWICQKYKIPIILEGETSMKTLDQAILTIEHTAWQGDDIEGFHTFLTPEAFVLRDGNHCDVRPFKFDGNMSNAEMFAKGQMLADTKVGGVSLRLDSKIKPTDNLMVVLTQFYNEGVSI